MTSIKAPPLPPRPSSAPPSLTRPQNQSAQAPTSPQQGPTQTTGTFVDVHTQPAPAPQDTFTVSSPSAHVEVTGLAPQTKPHAAGNVQASAPTQAAGNVAPTQDGAKEMVKYARQYQGNLLGQIAEGLKTGKISEQELGPLLESAQKLDHASGEASAKAQFTPDDTNNLCKVLVEHQQKVEKALNKSSLFIPIFSQFSSKKPSEAQLALAQQVGELGQNVLQGRIRDGDLSKLVSQQFGSPAGAGHAETRPPVAGTGGVGGMGAPTTPAETIQQMGALMGKLHSALDSLSVLRAQNQETPTPAQASVQQEGSSLASVNSSSMSTEQISALRQGLQGLGDAIKTTSAKKPIEATDLLNLCREVVRFTTDPMAAFKQP